MTYDLSPCQPWLDRDPILYLDLTEPVRRGIGRVVTASPQGALVAYTNGAPQDQPNSFSLFARDPATARQLLDLLPSAPETVFVHEDFSADLLARRPGMTMSKPFIQAAYRHPEPLSLPVSDADIRPLTLEHLPLILTYYDHGSEAYCRYLLASGALYGLFEGDTLLGFAGYHTEEGSIGLLDILPAYRRRGLARLLQSWLINRELSLGHIPYGQIFEDNLPSLSLQRALGMTFSEGRGWFALRD